ncbi:uncharacterized protein LOC118648495 [Monomorium pharaonis]|uniref:uncharacterized protein LOC118648495 n=1 Tax=Monomorium pharaonis TaxID=307658 RepID=UPI0017477931|nr:uncharacterized protein LOC118648495 [Monomorium pharaonis]
MAESQKSGKSDRPPTPQLDVPHDERASSRHASPVRLSTELTLKVQSQWNRITALKRISETIPATPEETSLDELNQLLSHIEEIHKAFTKEHAYFEVSWPSALVNHDYFTKGAQLEETMLHLAAKRTISRLRNALTVTPAQPTTASTSSATHDSHLPDISLPKFSGVYSDWPEYRDLFGSMIINNERLTPVEKLHYLRVSLEGAPAKHISGYPMAADSFHPSWEALKDKYENKRLLITSYLDRIFDGSGPIQRKAEQLTTLIDTVQESLTSINSLGLPVDLGDAILVHHVIKKLDRVTREQWETKIGAERSYPRFEQLVTFLTARACALENIEAVSSSYNSNSSSTARKPRVTAHQTSQNKVAADNVSTVYPCDCCQGQHYVVTCIKFRELAPADRQKIAVDKRLCFNCLGRHNVRSCKSTTGCKKCLQRHHTMLHEVNTSTSAQPAASSPTQPSK